VDRYGRVDTVTVAVIDCLWYGAFGDTPGRLVQECGKGLVDIKIDGERISPQ